jgi:hypothetical protein
MAQPVYPQLRKYPVRPGTYASCQEDIRSSVEIPSELARSDAEPLAKRGGHVGVGRKT